jgi:hypothetical protein
MWLTKSACDSRSACPLWRPIFFFLLCTAVLISGCKGGSTGDTQPDPQEEPQVFSTTTDVSGLAEIQDDDGAALMRIQTTDENGTPLADVDVIYLDSTPYPIVAFCQPETGDPAGTFQAVSGVGGAELSVTAADTAMDMGVFLLNYLDPTLSRLYDPQIDQFEPAGQSNLEEVRHLVDLDALRMYLLVVPGLEAKGRYTLSYIREVFTQQTVMRLFEKHGDCVDPAEECQMSLRTAILMARTVGQNDSYTYEIIADGNLENRFFLPMGVAASVTIDSPLDGVTITSEDERDIEVTGSINLPPDVLTLEGGHVELWVNGVHFPDALGVGGDGTGKGSLFSSSSQFQLAEGENTFRVVAYVSEINRGLENGAGGEAGEAIITINYEGGTSGGNAPSLTLLTHPTTLPCPNGASPVAFDFSDPDGDVVTAYQNMSWSMNGQTGSELTIIDVYEYDRGACLRGTSAQCSFDLTYWDMKGGDWIMWEFWVVDAEGLASQKLSFTVYFTGDCSQSDSSPAGFQCAVTGP